MPFSVAVAWSFMRILSPVTRVTLVSIVLPFANEVAKVPAAAVAALTDSFHLRPAMELST